jgi:cobalt-zinc-cadmium efflux system protein
MGIHLHLPWHNHGHGHHADHEHGHGHGHGYGHGHGHDHGPKDADSVPRALRRALAVTALFMAVEFVGGWWANSLALISDAAHMLTDVGALSLSLFAWYVSRKPSSPQMSFGYQRAEILGALASGLVIWLLAGVLVFEAVSRFRSPPAVDAPVVVGVGVIGLAANLASLFFLRRGRRDNMNVRAAYLHVVADSLGSVAAILSGVVLWLTDFRLIDPIVTLAFAALILFSSWRLVRDSVNVLMESTPAGIDAEAVRAELQAIAGVREAHDLHIWTVSSGKLALSVHLVATGDPAQVLAQANAVLEARYRILHTTIQIEHPEQFRSERCYDCAH